MLVLAGPALAEISARVAASSVGLMTFLSSTWLYSIALSVALVMMLTEARVPGRSWPTVAGWWSRALLLNAVGILTVFLYGTALVGWLQQHRLWSADLGVVSGAVFRYLVLSFVNYWWHWLRHKSDFCWRWFHQLHHSTQRIEVVATFYKHPFEGLVDSLGASVILYLLLGLSPEAAAGSMLLAGLIEMFYHWNIDTPQWLGYIVQRPESHCVHHEENLHAYNYADLPIWDILFGTFRNPPRWAKTCGLGAENEQRLADMLKGVDVTLNPLGAGSVEIAAKLGVRVFGEAVMAVGDPAERQVEEPSQRHPRLRRVLVAEEWQRPHPLAFAQQRVAGEEDIAVEKDQTALRVARRPHRADRRTGDLDRLVGRHLAQPMRGDGGRRQKSEHTRAPGLQLAFAV
jgi:sterol desaturase/sphingolipid hydroxylase (fatty acid hydroxylase superfamily)